MYDQAASEQRATTLTRTAAGVNPARTTCRSNNSPDATAEPAAFGTSPLEFEKSLRIDSISGKLAAT